MIDYQKYKCTGPETTLKQKNVKKLFIHFLKDLRESKERMDRGDNRKARPDQSPEKAISNSSSMMRTNPVERDMNKSATEFMQLMDYIQDARHK